MIDLHEIAVRGPYDQFGEDATLTYLLDQIGGPQYRRCAEFGAGDGIACSTTLQKWRHDGWAADLIETNNEQYEHLHRFVTSACDGPCERTNHNGTDRHTHTRTDGQPVTTTHTKLTPDNINHLITGNYDHITIDVDGPDYHLWNALTTQPRIVLIERNHTIPWWIDVHQTNLDAQFGASAAALNRLAETKGYTLVGSVGPNLFFVRADQVDEHGLERVPFAQLMAEHEQLEPTITYMASDYTGRRRLFGAPCPWGHLPEPCDDELTIQ